MSKILFLAQTRYKVMVWFSNSKAESFNCTKFSLHDLNIKMDKNRLLRLHQSYHIRHKIY